MIEDAAMHEAYVRVITPEHSPSEETEDVCYMLQEAMELRHVEWRILSRMRVFQWPRVGAGLRRFLGCMPRAWLRSGCRGGGPVTGIQAAAQCMLIVHAFHPQASDELVCQSQSDPTLNPHMHVQAKVAVQAGPIPRAAVAPGRGQGAV